MPSKQMRQIAAHCTVLMLVVMLTMPSMVIAQGTPEEEMIAEKMSLLDKAKAKVKEMIEGTQAKIREMKMKRDLDQAERRRQRQELKDIEAEQREQMRSLRQQNKNAKNRIKKLKQDAKVARDNAKDLERRNQALMRDMMRR